MAIQIGDSVGDYVVIGLAGAGGMGAVYKIEHAITKRVEAMKALPVALATGSEEIHLIFHAGLRLINLNPA